MTDAQSVLLPFLVDILTHKPLLSETKNNLLKDVKKTLNCESIQLRDLREKLDAAIDTGKSLGILAVQNEEVRVRGVPNSRSVVTDYDTGRSKSAPETSHKSRKRDPINKRISYGNSENNSTEDCRGYRSQNRSRSRSRRRKSNSKRSARSKR